MRLIQHTYYYSFYLFKEHLAQKPENSDDTHHSVLISFRSHSNNGGAKRDRTADLLRAKQALSQLSYSPLSPHKEW